MSQYGKPKELNTKPLIVCALEVETQGQLDDYDVLYTGVGKVNATYALTSHLDIITLFTKPPDLIHQLFANNCI